MGKLILVSSDDKTKIRKIDSLNENFSGFFSTLEYSVSDNMWRLEDDFCYIKNGIKMLIPKGFTITDIGNNVGWLTRTVCGDKIVRSVFVMAYMKSRFVAQEDIIQAIYHVLRHEGYGWFSRFMISFGFRYL